MRQPARREAGSCPIFFMNSFYMVETFNCHGELVHTLIDPGQPRQPLCFSASYLISVLQLFTRLEELPVGILHEINFFCIIIFMYWPHWEFKKNYNNISTGSQ